MTNLLTVLLRPKSITDIIGQEHILKSGGLIHQMLKYKKIYSLIFYGPPGIGKTSLAQVLCNELNLDYTIFIPSIEKKEKIIKVLDLVKKNNNKLHVLIIDEIHRLNRDKQDILLPFLENGLITVFATTTENPYFTINPAIRSRCQIIELNPLNPIDIFKNLKMMISRNKIKNLIISDKNLMKICEVTNGDYRSTLNIIDILINLYPNHEINEEILTNVLKNKFIIASHYGDTHYNLLSALHKSLRGSDPDAAIYYTAQLLAQGDLISLNRRLIACAYEDIGLANPQLCDRVINATKAAIEVGMPECVQIYGDIVIEMCLSPKSNSGYLAINEAIKDVEGGKIYPIPLHLCDQSYSSAAKLNRKGYKYPHDFGGYVKQQYLPIKLGNVKYYKMNKNGIEEKLNYWLKLQKNK